MRRRTVIGVLLAALALLFAAPALAQEEAAPAAATTAADVIPPEQRIYNYDTMGRRDPFVSLLRAVTGEDRELTGDPLRDNDISQMRVIAIVWDEKESYALFGLPDGKYYTVKEGMKIGLHGGRVEEILEDSVLIQEQKPDFRGQLRPVDTYLRLRQEEGQ